MPAGPVATHDWKRYVDAAPPGAIAEFGCFDGGSARILATLGRPVFAFDTFDGIPAADFRAGEDAENPPGKFRPSAPPWRLFEQHPNVYPVVGRYAETLPTLAGLRFAFVYIDCDLYESYRQVLEYAVPRLDGDVFMCDDYGCTGAKRAVDEWLRQHPEWTFDGRSVFTRRPLVLCSKCKATLTPAEAAVAPPQPPASNHRA